MGARGAPGADLFPWARGWGWTDRPPAASPGTSVQLKGRTISEPAACRRTAPLWAAGSSGPAGLPCLDNGHLRGSPEEGGHRLQAGLEPIPSDILVPSPERP